MTVAPTWFNAFTVSEFFIHHGVDLSRREFGCWAWSECWRILL
jgi:hypothetical protein